MILRIEAFASLYAGNRLRINIAINAEKSHPEISSTVEVVINGLVIRIIVVMIIPSDIPMPKLVRSTIADWIAEILIIILGLAPIARKMANS